MTVGGSGFFALTYRGQRLAYLQPKGQRSVSQFPPEFAFFEIWNVIEWDTMIAGHGGDLIVVLQRAIDAGELGLHHTRKTLMGLVAKTNYDLSGTKITALADDPEQVVICGHQIAKTFKFSPAPQVVPIPVSPATYVPASSLSEDKPIEIGGYALRTFKVTNDKLGSLYKPTTWDNGVAIAECLAPQKCESPPGENCSCGLYGFLSLDELIRDYGANANRSVAVFEPEGDTVIGPRGLKTAAARIVAYWCSPPETVAHWDRGSLAELQGIYAAQCPDAKEFFDIAAMLKAYDLPESEYCAKLMRTYPDTVTKGGSAPFWRAGVGRLQPLASTATPSVAGQPVQLPPGGGWKSVAPLMTAASPAGVDVVKKLLDHMKGLGP